MRVVISNPWVQAGGLIAALAGLGVISYLMSSVLVPLFFAFLVAYTFDPVIDYIETHGFSRMLAILLLVIGLCLMTVMLPLFLVPSIIEQGQSLVEAAKAPHAPDIVDRALNALPLEYWIRELGWAAPDEEVTDPRHLIIVKVGQLVSENATDFLSAHARDLLGVGQKATTTAANIFTEVASRFMAGVLFFGNFALFIFVAVYLLKDYDHIVAHAGELIPPRYRKTSVRIFSQIDAQLKAWLRGQAFVCLCLGLMYVIGFLISGVPFGIVLGLFGGIVSFVPFLGLALTIGPAVLLTLLKYGMDWHVAGAIVTLLLAQALEGNVITPRIMGKQVGLAPVWVILAIMVFGSTLGFVGLLLAVPIAAVLKVLIVEAHDRYVASGFFKNRPDEPEQQLVIEVESEPVPEPVRPPRKRRPKANEG